MQYRQKKKLQLYSMESNSATQEWPKLLNDSCAKLFDKQRFWWRTENKMRIFKFLFFTRWRKYWHSGLQFTSTVPITTNIWVEAGSDSAVYGSLPVNLLLVINAKLGRKISMVELQQTEQRVQLHQWRDQSLFHVDVNQKKEFVSTQSVGKKEFKSIVIAS